MLEEKQTTLEVNPFTSRWEGGELCECWSVVFSDTWCKGCMQTELHSIQHIDYPVHYSFYFPNYAHNSKNLKLMYQLQDSRLLNSKNNSIVFTHIEILNHFFFFYKAQSTFSTLGSPGKHWPSKRHTQSPTGLTHFTCSNSAGKTLHSCVRASRGLRWAHCV